MFITQFLIIHNLNILCVIFMLLFFNDLAQIGAIAFLQAIVRVLKPSLYDFLAIARRAIRKQGQTANCKKKITK